MRRPLWKRLGPMEKAIAAGIAAIAAGGLFLIADGLYIKAKAELSQVLLERSFAAELAGADNVRPWPWADFVTEAEISAPRLKRSAVVLSGASGETLAFGPALLAGTPRPGEEGTAVIAAHRDTHFAWLKDVKAGDRIEVLRRDGKRLTFIAGKARIARWDESGIDPHAFGHNLALSTCWPFDAKERGPLRYIVEASLAPDSEVAAGMLGSTRIN